MLKLAFSLAGASAVLAFILTIGSACAANVDHSWVSSTGSGSTCTRAAPCPNFQSAHDVTNPGGVISVLDPGDFGALSISKSITVRAEGVDGGGTISPHLGNFFQITAGAADEVTLEGLHFNGAGIDFVSGGQLHIVRCVFTNGNVSGQFGILFRPNGVSKLSVTDTAIINSGLGTGGGIVIEPSGSGSAQVALERVTVNGNAFGIAADGSSSTGGINVTIADSMVADNNQDGIIATTPGGGAPIGVYVKNTKAANNAIGIRSLGPNVTVRVDGSGIIGNGTGLAFGSGGALLTAGNNMVQANGTNGTFSGSVGLQ